MANNTDDQIIEIINPHVKSIRSLYDDALVEFNEILNATRTRINKGAKAKLFHNLVIERAKIYFKNVAGIEISDKYESLVIGFNKGIVGRFKKLSKQKLNSRNATTSRNTMLLQGTLFPNYEPNPLIEIGYVINDLWSEFLRVVVIAKEGKSTRVLIEIYSNEAAENLITFKAEEVKLETVKEEQLKIKGR